MAIPAKKMLGVPAPDVSIIERVLHVHQYCNHNPRVVEVVDNADDPVQALDDLLDIGAQAWLAAGVTLDTAAVERRFDGMAHRFGTHLTEAVDQITDVTSVLLDEEDGAIPKVLGEVKQDIAAILSETFDEDRNTSALAKIDRVVREAQARLATAVRQDLDPDADGSPMGRVVKGIGSVVKDQTALVLGELRDIAVHMAKEDGRAEVINLTTGKGFTFEDLVHAQIGQIAALHGDTCEHTGKTAGVTGTQKGDTRLTINADDTMGADVRFVIEAKDKKMTLPKTIDELGQCMANHNATAGVIVFAGQDLAPTAVPFSPMGDKAVVVYDKDDPDVRVLQLAYMWARWVVRRGLARDAEETLDFPRIEASIHSAQQALAILQTIKACHSSARKKIDEAGDHALRLVRDVDAALKILKDELS